MFNVVVFSKDRPAQLDLLIRSMQKNLLWKNTPKRIEKIYILYKCSDGRYKSGYHRLIGNIPDVFCLYEEHDFKEDLIYMVDVEKPYTFFLVDDNIFVRRAYVEDYAVYLRNEKLICYSMRMAPGYTYCYATDTRMKPMGKPTWDWRNAPGDYGYPMSLDGHIYRTGDIINMIKTLEYDCPNRLEGMLMVDPPKRKMIMCGQRAKLVGLPWNKVQTINGNRHMGMSQENFLYMFLNNMQISFGALEKFFQDNPIVSCHTIAPVLWENKNG